MNGFSLLVNNNTFNQAPPPHVVLFPVSAPTGCHFETSVLFNLFVAQQSVLSTPDDSIASKIWFYSTECYEYGCW